MTEQSQDYKELLAEIIQKQIVILGPAIAVMKARNIPGLKVSDDGTVTGIEGDSRVVVKKLIEEYVALSGLIVKKAMEPLLEKYPSVKL